MTDDSAHVTYWATSIFASRTCWLNTVTAIVAALTIPEVTRIVPLTWLPTLGAIVAVANLYLRTQTVRPVALIALGTAVPVRVPKIDPSAGPILGD